jgi:tetratricopeptide (TPR) repeat protein
MRAGAWLGHPEPQRHRRLPRKAARVLEDAGQCVLDLGVGVIADPPRRPRLEVLEGTSIAARPHPARLREHAVRIVGRDTAADDLAFDPDWTAEQWCEAGLELEATDPERAVEAYEHALQLDASLADAHVNLGRLLHIAGELGRAEPHYREAVRIDPNDPTPHFNLGVLLEEVGRRDEAILAYRQAILRDPEFADAHCNLGLLLESLGRRQEAVRHLMAARKLSGSPA